MENPLDTRGQRESRIAIQFAVNIRMLETLSFDAVINVSQDGRAVVKVNGHFD